MITRSRLKRLVTYEPDTGLFRWVYTHGKVKAGTIAGSSWKGRYWRLSLDYRTYNAHSLAFLWMTGKMPPNIDHRNRDGNDNRWSNLRKASQNDNARNRGLTARNRSGFIGVYQCCHTRRWVAQIRRDSKSTFLGRYKTPEDAARARDRVARREHGEFAVLNFPC